MPALFSSIFYWDIADLGYLLESCHLLSVFAFDDNAVGKCYKVVNRVRADMFDCSCYFYWVYAIEVFVFLDWANVYC